MVCFGVPMTLLWFLGSLSANRWCCVPVLLVVWHSVPSTVACWLLSGADLSVEMEIFGRVFTVWYYAEPGGLWWTSVLNSALPPQRHSSDTRLEHQDPVSHTAKYVGSFFLWEVWPLLPAFNRCSVGVVPHLAVFLMYLWRGKWSPRLTPLPSWRSPLYYIFFNWKSSQAFFWTHVAILINMWWVSSQCYRVFSRSPISESPFTLSNRFLLQMHINF